MGKLKDLLIEMESRNPYSDRIHPSLKNAAKIDREFIKGKMIDNDISSEQISNYFNEILSADQISAFIQGRLTFDDQIVEEI